MIKIRQEKNGFSFDLGHLPLSEAIYYYQYLWKEKGYFELPQQRNRWGYAPIRSALENINLFASSKHSKREIYEVPFIKELVEQGVIDWGSLQFVAKAFKKRANRFSIETMSIENFKQTAIFSKAKKRVDALYGNRTFSDNSQLFNYQIECASLIGSKKRLVNALDTGMGKTRTTLVGLVSNPSNRKIIIVTMSRNIADWEREIRLLGLEDDTILLKTPNDMRSNRRIHLVSYETWAKEQVKYLADMSPEKEKKNCSSCSEKLHAGYCTNEYCERFGISSRKKALFKYFKKGNYDAAAIDEGHLIKNGNTSRCKSILAIKTKTRILLSGTPAENGATDLFWLLAWVIGDKLNFYDAKQQVIFQAYGSAGQKDFKDQFGGVNQKTVMDSLSIEKRLSSHSDLWNILDTVMFRKRKLDEDVSGDLKVPEPIHRRIHIEMRNDEKNVYNSVLNDFKEWFSEMEKRKKLARLKGAPIVNETIKICSWLEKLRRVASAPWLHPDYKGIEMPSKLEFIRNKMLECAARKQKMLIFTAQKSTAEELGKILNGFVSGYDVNYIHGSVPMQYRTELRTRFQNPTDSLSVLVMTMRTGAESYTLTEAKNVIFMDLDYNAKKIEQCYSRAVRLGQKDRVEINWLISLDTIDANIHALILSKKAGVDQAIDRVEMNFEEIAKEFEGDIAQSTHVDFETFAKTMLSRGNTRKDYESVG